MEEGDVNPLQVAKFYESVRCFSERAVEYSLKNLPLSDELLKNARVIDFERRLQADMLQLEYFVQR